MFIPPRDKRGAAKPCGRTPRMLSAFTVGAVALGATLGMVPSATADPASVGGQKLFVDIVGDSYMAGEGTADTYLDSADPRHRSLVSPALQALSRVVDENPGIQVDANVVASSGAVTADYFGAQRAPDASGAEVVVNTAQHDQIRPNAQVVIVGFGGSDAELAQVLSVAKPSNSSKPGDLDAKVKNFGGLLDASGSDQTYLDQATASSLGQAPMLVSRMLQVLAGISQRAPQARIFVTTYPLAVDPENPHSVALIKKHDLITVQKFLFDLNAAIERAVRICACANLVDMTDALDGHEAYTGESAYREPAGDSPHGSVVIQPSEEGAALMADPLAKNLATWLGIVVPKPGDGRVALPRNIITRSGEPDVDGDLVPDFDDAAPQDPAEHRRKSDRPHHDDSPERRDAQPSHHGKHTKAPHISDPKGTGKEGRHEKDDGPAGHIPVVLVLPLSPPPKREYEPESLPEDRRVAVPDSAERRPAPAVERVTADRETSGRDTEFGREVSGDAEEIVPEAPVPVADEETGFVPWTPERDEPSGVEWSAPEAEVEYRSESVGFGEFVEEDQPEPAEAQDIVGWTGEAQPAPEGNEWLTEPAETAPADTVPVDAAPAEVVPAEVPENSTPEQTVPTDAAPEETAWPSEPVEVVPVEPEPDEATDSQQVCILIYPAPAGCGGTGQEGSFS